VQKLALKKITHCFFYSVPYIHTYTHTHTHTHTY